MTYSIATHTIGVTCHARWQTSFTVIHTPKLMSLFIIQLFKRKRVGYWYTSEWLSAGRMEWACSPSDIKPGWPVCFWPQISLHFLLSLNHGGCWGTTDDFTTSFLHFSLFATTLWDLANSRLVHSQILSFHLFFFLPCLLPPFTLPCKMVLARPYEW